MIHSEQFLKRRKFLTFLPLLVLPFVTVVFWILGGGQGKVTVVTNKTGLNLQLPDANIKNASPLDKMRFYQAADADSVKRMQQKAIDPNYKEVTPFKLPVYHQPSYDDNAVSKRIAKLQRQIEEPEQIRHEPPIIAERQPDPEMEAINGTLEKILDIQHPERVKEKALTKKAFAYSVSGSAIGSDDYIGKADSSKNGFYEGLENEGHPIGLSAVVQGEQIIETGSLIKFRLLSDLYVNGNRIGAGNFIYGIASIDGNIIKVHFNTVGTENAQWPVALQATIYVHGAMAGEVVKQSTDNALQSLGALNYDPSLKAQATAAGIGAAKSLFSKKLKRQTVTVKSGYKVLLLNEQNQ